MDRRTGREHAFLSRIYNTIHRTIARQRNLVRHLNIRAKGWPPAHLDADGDFRSDQDDIG